MKKQRPVHLDLQTIRFPATAIASILHRVSGVIMLFAVGILIWLLNQSLASPESFAATQSLLIICWLNLSFGEFLPLLVIISLLVYAI